MIRALVCWANRDSLPQQVRAPCRLSGNQHNHPDASLPKISTGLLNLTPGPPSTSRCKVKQKGLQRSAATAPPLAPLFFEAPQYPVGNSVEAVVSGDFNSDGKVDLVIADYCMDEDAR